MHPIRVQAIFWDHVDGACTTAHGRGGCWDHASQVGGTTHVSNSSARTHPRLCILSVSNLAILLLNLVTFQTILATFFQRHLETKLDFLFYLATFDKHQMWTKQAYRANLKRWSRYAFKRTLERFVCGENAIRSRSDLKQTQRQKNCAFFN